MMRTLDRNAEPVSPVQTVKTVLKTGRVIWFFFPSLINNMRRHSWIPTLCHLICWRGISVFHLSKHFAPKSQCHLLWMTCFNVDCWVITKCANEVFKHEHGKWILFFFTGLNPHDSPMTVTFWSMLTHPNGYEGRGPTNFSLFQLAEISRLLTDLSQMFRADYLQNRAWVKIRQQINSKHVRFKGGEIIALSKLSSK